MLLFNKPMASEQELEAETMEAKYPCGLSEEFLLTIDNSKELMEHKESGENSEDCEIIFQRWLDKAIERMWRQEIRKGRVHSGMPDNPVGFIEDF